MIDLPGVFQDIVDLREGHLQGKIHGRYNAGHENHHKQDRGDAFIPLSLLGEVKIVLSAEDVERERTRKPGKKCKAV